MVPVPPGRRPLAPVARRPAAFAPHPRRRLRHRGEPLEYGRLGEVTGVDAFPEAIELCRERGLDNVLEAPVEELPFEPGSFDLMFATDVIEHLDDDVLALRELRRVAADGARLVLTVPAYGWLWSDHDVSVHHRRRYTADRLRESVRAAGWRPAVDTYFFATALPAVARRAHAAAAGARTATRGSDLSLPPGPRQPAARSCRRSPRPRRSSAAPGCPRACRSAWSASPD